MPEAICLQALYSATSSAIRQILNIHESNTCLFISFDLAWYDVGSM